MGPSSPPRCYGAVVKSRLGLILILVVASDTLYRIEPSGGQPGGTSDIGLTVTEPAGVTRINERVTTGVPISGSQTGARWALFDGSTEIPVQTTVLPGVRTPWLLVDFQTSLAPHGARLFTLKPIPSSVTPRPALDIREDATQVTVVTGPLQVVVGKSDFNLFEGVWFDQNADGTFAGAERIVAPSGGANLFVRDAGSGLDYSGRGAPSRFAWEDQGPLRATLRVDGSFRRGTTGLLDYTTRLTFVAGASAVQIDVALRNSFQPQERYLKLASAKLNVGRTSTTDRLKRSGARLWADVPTGGASIELIPDSVSVSMTYDPDASPPLPRVNMPVVVDANGGLVIGDLSYHGGRITLDFAPGLSAAQQQQRTTASRFPLLALASPQWYSDLGAFGSDHFGTFDDEKRCYQQWGWSWPTAGQCWSYEHDLPLYRDFAPSWETIDAFGDPESDDLWSNLLMLARTGHYPYFLRAEGWASYMKEEFTHRTDGFAYAGDDFWDGPNPVSRDPVMLPPAPTVADLAYIDHNIRHGKVAFSHTWNGGLVDYYYLTGDRDALQAALDLAEQSSRYQAWRTPGANSGAAGGRFEARSYLNSLRAWEATGDAAWRGSADHIRDLFLLSPSYDARGFYYSPTCDIGPDYCARFPNGKSVSPFQLAVVVQACYRDYVLTGSSALRARLLAMAACADQYGSDPATGYTGDEMVFDAPAGTVRHLSYSEFANTAPVIPSLAASSGAWIDALVIGYRLSGNMGYLRHARQLWDRASKGDSGQTFAGPQQVGRFVNSLECWNKESVFFPNSGDLTSTQFVFYEASRADLKAPGEVRNLSGH